MSTLPEGITENVPEAVYLTDTSLSQSSIKTLLDCPARFLWERENPRVVGDAADLGSVVHGMVLGTGSTVEVIDATDWRTKAAREAKEDAQFAGKVPILASAYAEAQAMAEAVLAHPLARALLEAPGDAELSMRWTHQHEGQPVALRGRIDKASVVDRPEFTLVDLKTARSASPRMFASQVFNYGYHVQQVVYQDGWQTLTGIEPDFQFIVVESARPFLTAVYRLDDAAIEYGWQQYQEALSTFLTCQATGYWPGYTGDAVETLISPRWVRGVLRFQNSEADF